MSKNWWVHKFGGTSLKNAQAFLNVTEILQQKDSSKVAVMVIVSAVDGVTTRLFRLIAKALDQDKSYLKELHSIESDHLKLIGDLGLHQDLCRDFKTALARDLSDITDLLKALWVSRDNSITTEALITGYGEIWSAQILSMLLVQQEKTSQWIDARTILVVGRGETGPIVNWKSSQEKLTSITNSVPVGGICIVTGYIASTESGKATTLGRNGSDFSAAILASLLNAKSLVIWTDVDGVMSADPNKVPEAFVIDELSYNEAMELAYFGAKILHPQSMSPVMQKSIPTYIRNSFAPKKPGTLIQAKTVDQRVKATSSREHAKSSQLNRQVPFLVKGLSTIDDVALISLEGSGMIGVPGVAQRLFGSLKEVGVSVILISQGSSEHSICFVVPMGQSELAQKTVRTCFDLSFSAKQIQNLTVFEPCSVLALVGDSMVSQVGVSAQFFASLSRVGVNVRAIAQGSSERNISVVINQKDSIRGLRAAHAGFYLSRKTLSIGLIGPGLIGSTLLAQLAENQDILRKKYGVNVKLRGLMNSKSMLLDDQGIALGDWEEGLKSQGEALDYDVFAKHIRASHLPHWVIIDASASEKTGANYKKWLTSGIHIITPNKKANSGSEKEYQSLQMTSREHRAHYLYETTVGAGLPIISTLRDLIATGDEIHRIEGVLSGTLAYIFNAFNSKVNFSDIVKSARAQGFTEPDPRDDLSGMDVARKVVILGREMGLSVEIADFEVENLVPKSLVDIASVEDFLTQLPSADPLFHQKVKAAEENNSVLRYVGYADAKEGFGVALKVFSKDHPFAGIQGSDNMICFTTQRYKAQPLIVRGPGAGPEVTAAGVFSDLLRLASFFG